MKEVKEMLEIGSFERFRVEGVELIIKVDNEEGLVQITDKEGVWKTEFYLG